MAIIAAIIGIMAIIGRGGRTVATMVPVGIRVTELMSPQGMAIRPSVSTPFTAGIRAITAIELIGQIWVTYPCWRAYARLEPPLPV